MIKRFKTSKWIFLSLSVLTNLFLILYSTLPSELTAKWTSFISNWFIGIINNATQKEIIDIPMTELSIGMSSDKYNNIPGYESNQIPLGSAKQLGCTYLPLDTTDKSIQYYADDSSIVKLNPSSTTVSVVGMKIGKTRVHAKNKLSGIDESFEVEVIDEVEPVTYEISLNTYEIPLYNQETIKFDIDGGVLGHNELINSRYYDTRLLTYESSNTSVATVDNNGVIKALTIGTSNITVKNSNGFEKTITVTTISGEPVIPYSDLRIAGSNSCYDNDMILDQSSGKNHYQLSLYDEETKLLPEDFIWTSSNELLARVDRHGVLRGFRKTKVEDESVTITATSKLTGQSVDFEVLVKEQIPTSIYFWIVNGDKTTWNPENYTAFVGENLSLNIGYTPNISKKDVTYVVSKDGLIDCTNQGSVINVRVVTEGDCTLAVTSVVNPELSFHINFTILKAGAITTDDIHDVELSVRKVVGHALLFAIAETFTIIAAYMFLYNKKKWIPIVISLAAELFLASLSEFIQYFQPDRHGTFVDVAINFGGAIIGALIVIGIYALVRYIKKKKEDKIKRQ